VKSIKEHLKQMRESFTEPEQLLSVEPLVASWEEHITEISKIDHQIMHDTLPSVVAAILKIMNEALVFDRNQTKNIDEQIAAMRATKNLSPRKKQEAYERQLIPLMEQEEEIERQRQTQNFEQRLKDVAKTAGYK